MRRRFLLVWAIVIPLFCLNYVSVKGQNIGTQVNNALDYMFEDMNLTESRIPTGYLLDRACELTNLRAYDGAAITNDNFSDVSSFRNALYTINSAIVNSNGAAYDADTITDQLADTTQVKIGAALFKYNYIVDNALTDNLISYQNGKVGDVTVNGILQNPFSEAKFFIFTPGRSIFKDSEIIRYTFSRSALLGNITLGDNDIIEFDPGDGDGYRLVDPSLDITVDYYSSGIKELKMRITFSNNTSLIGHSKIEIQHLDIIPATINHTFPDGSFTKTFTTQDNKKIKAHVTYKSSHNSQIIKPLIYVEGFDNKIFGAIQSLIHDIPDSVLINARINDIINSLDYASFALNLTHSLPGVFDFNWLYDESLNNSIKNEYDVFYVNIENPTASILDNAKLLESVIVSINSLKSPLSERNVIIGHSMGGLIARCALIEMENSSGINHETDHYISIDSPHLGVNLPISIQYALDRLIKAFYVVNLPSIHLSNILLTYLYSIYCCPSAKQMMFSFIDPLLGYTTSFHDSWQATLNFLGFPKGDIGHPIENIAIANGGQYYATPTNTLFGLSLSLNSDDNSLLTNASEVSISMEGFRNNGSGGTVLSASGSFKKYISWLDSEYTIHLYGSSSNNYQSTINSPSVYGFDSINSSLLLVDDVPPSSFAGIDFLYNGPIYFVPTASALSDNSTNSYQRNYYTNPLIPVSDTPFSSLSIESSATFHEFHNWEFINSVLKTNLTVPSAWVCNGDMVNVSDSTGYANPSLSTSDATLATINNNGEITVLAPGLVTINYSNDDGPLKKVLKQQQVLTGVPTDFHISYQQSGTYFQFTAACNNESINNFIDSAAAGERLFISWGVKIGNSPIQWMEINSRSFDTTLSSTSTVYIKIVDELNRQHLLLFDTVFSSSPLTNYDPIMIYTVFGNAILYYNTIHDDGVQENYLYLWNQLSQSYPLPPDRIIIDNQTIMRDAILTETVNGNQKSVYCFKILTSTYVQSVIANIDNYPNKTAIVSGAVYSGSNFIQNLTLTITKGFPPLP